MKNKGLHQHRFNQNPLEKKFAAAWEKENTLNSVGNNLLDYLLAKDNRPDQQCEVRPRDRVVAATVIQWLGSPVGQYFLKDLLK